MERRGRSIGARMTWAPSADNRSDFDSHDRLHHAINRAARLSEGPNMPILALLLSSLLGQADAADSMRRAAEAAERAAVAAQKAAEAAEKAAEAATKASAAPAAAPAAAAPAALVAPAGPP